MWFENEEFQNLIHENWKHFQEDVEAPASVQFVVSIQLIKDKVSSRARARRKQKERDLWDVEQELEHFYEKNMGHMSASLILEKCHSIESSQTKILSNQ